MAAILSTEGPKTLLLPFDALLYIQLVAWSTKPLTYMAAALKTSILAASPFQFLWRHKAFVKLRPVHSGKLVFSHFRKVIKIKITAKIMPRDAFVLKGKYGITRNAPEKFRETSFRAFLHFSPGLKGRVTSQLNGTPIDHVTVVCLVAWPLNESEAGDDLEICIWKAVRFLSKQGQLQPHFHSKARQLSTQL